MPTTPDSKTQSVTKHVEGSLVIFSGPEFDSLQLHVHCPIQIIMNRTFLWVNHLFFQTKQRLCNYFSLTIMNRTKVIQLNDKKIFLCDLKGLEREEILTVSQQTWNLFSTELIHGEKANFLIDITNVDIPPMMMEEIASMAERYKNNIAKEGVVGLHGFRKTMLNMYGLMIGSKLKAFENQESALIWLTA